MRICCKKAIEAIEIRGKVYLAISPEKTNGFSKVKKIYSEKQRVMSYFLALSNSSPCDFYGPGFLFKVLGKIENSLLLCRAKRDVDEICKSRSRTKVREEGQYSAVPTYYTFHYLVPAIVKHYFSRTSRTF